MTDTDGLAAIRAGLDRDERTAMAALGKDVCCWETERDGGHDRLIAMLITEDGEDTEPIGFFGGPHIAEHAARQDPRRALLDVAAKRELLGAAVEHLHNDDRGTDPMAALVIEALAKLYLNENHA